MNDLFKIKVKMYAIELYYNLIVIDIILLLK